MSNKDIAMRQRLPGDRQLTTTKSSCIYQIFEADWKPNEGYAYDSNRSLDIVAKVQLYTILYFTRIFAKYAFIFTSVNITSFISEYEYK